MKPVEKLLEPFSGYIHLGMYLDAQEELESLPEEVKTHPLVLEARMILFVELKKWEEAALIGDLLCELWPTKLEFHFKTAYCLHQLKRIEDAKELLLAAPQTIRETAIYFYTLACYETELGRYDEACDCLKRCFGIDPKFRQIAMDEIALDPLWMCLSWHRRHAE